MTTPSELKNSIKRAKKVLANRGPLCEAVLAVVEDLGKPSPPEALDNDLELLRQRLNEWAEQKVQA